MINRCPGDLRSGKQRNLLFQFLADGTGKSFAVGDQNGTGKLIVLCLAQKIRCHVGRIAFSVSDHQDLTGACDHVDGNLTKDLLLGLCHESIAGTHDLIHLGYALGAVGQGGDCLGAAHLENLIHTGNFGGCQDHRVKAAVSAGRGHHVNFRTACDFGGDGVHQHGGRIGGSTAGDVNAHPFNGGHLLA